MYDMKKYNTKHIWFETPKDDIFFSNVFNKKFSYYDKTDLHKTASYSGYKMKI